LCAFSVGVGELAGAVVDGDAAVLVGLFAPPPGFKSAAEGVEPVV
jgi:hypothetical protein